MSKKLLLIDGDEMVFKATSAIEQEVDWGDGNWVLWSNPETAYDNFTGIIDRLCTRFFVPEKEAILCFSGTYGDTPNFRLAIDPSYKGHRNDRKPMCYWQVRERAEAKYRCKSMPGLEADDVMGILATKPRMHDNAQCIICSQDKDMATLPTTVWNGKDLVTYTEAEADYFHMYQTLVGDTADGYKGCPGIGDVKAQKLLALTSEAETALSPEGQQQLRWMRIVDAFTKAELTEDDAIAQARLARILRHSDWDGEKKQPILWSPK